MHSAPYRVEEIEVGMLAQETVRSVKMPRERFLEIVEKTLLKGGYESIREDMMKTASAMPRFPLSMWLNPERGCGCVVGEYLVAKSELDRAAYIASNTHDGSIVMIDELLEENPLEEELVTFGNAIDRAIARELMNVGIIDNNVNCYISASYNVPDYVDSVEIVD